LSGFYISPTDFSPLGDQNLSNNKNIPIVGTIDVNINASEMVDSVVVGTFFVNFIISCQIAGDERWEVVNRLGII
jgi:hypothetical protein